MSENMRSEAQEELPRFPCKQIEYTKTVGRLLPTILGEIFAELGFKVKVNPQQENGVDIEVFLGDNLVLVAEILNWSIASRLTNRRKGNIITNLNEYNCNKVLIHTVPLSNLHALRENGIDLMEIGYQLLPETYYDFFLTKGQVESRNIDSDLIRSDIRGKVLDYINNHLFAHKFFQFLVD